MKRRISTVIPLPFQSTYHTGDVQERASWWMWAGRIFRHRRVVV